MHHAMLMVRGLTVLTDSRWSGLIRPLAVRRARDRRKGKEAKRQRDNSFLKIVRSDLFGTLLAKQERGDSKAGRIELPQAKSKVSVV